MKHVRRETNFWEILSGKNKRRQIYLEEKNKNKRRKCLINYHFVMHFVIVHESNTSIYLSELMSAKY